jgi:putative peptidoglycan lipid II flippase
VSSRAEDPLPEGEAAVAQTEAPAAGAYATLVAAGILLSRIAGLIRERVFAHYFGTSLYASAFRSALRMPNVLQNLLGEGTLSASFIPVYAELLERGRKEEAGRLAGAIFGLLLAVAALLSLIGVALAPVLVSIFLPGVDGEQREVTIIATRIIFPMTGVLVLSAWALGILNSHRKFFVSYFAPVLWNVAMIATLIFFGGRFDQRTLLFALAWGALIGGALQFFIQLPWVLRLERDLRIERRLLAVPGVRTVTANAGPAVMGRGVVQLSGWLDLVLASFLFEGAIAALGYAQTLYLLPVSLFGMSVAAAELPELSRSGTAHTEVLRDRLSAGLRQIALFVVPSAIGFVVLGDIIVAALYETGGFVRADTLLVWLILAGYSVGLLASTATRLYASAYYAMKDTRTPAKIALARVLIAAVIGATLMVSLEPVTIAGRTIGGAFELFAVDRPAGVVGLAVAAGIAAWIEWFLYRRGLRRRIGSVGTGGGVLLRMIGAALLAAAGARALSWALPPMPPYVLALFVLAPFGIGYFLLARAFGVEAAGNVLRRYLRRLGIGRRGRAGG